MPAFNSISLICQQCGRSYLVQPSQLKRYASRFCSRRCRTLSQQASEDGFWARVSKGSDCWLWSGTVAGNGYGTLSYKGKRWPAHRLAYTLTYGPISRGLLVCHKCDVPLCVRPDHLFLGTPLDNRRDADAKGRSAPPTALINPSRCARGERVQTAKLTADQVRWIRSPEAALLSGAEIAHRLSVQRTTVNKIRRGVSWRHIPNHPEYPDEAVSKVLRPRGGVSGERSPQAKITAIAAANIRRAYASGTATQKQLAAHYGISKAQVYYIVHGRSWAAGATDITPARSVKGAGNPSAKLTWEQAQEIRATAGAIPQKQLAARYGVSRASIFNILHGRTWTTA